MATKVEDLKRVEDIWDSIAIRQAAAPMTPEEKRELDDRLDVYQAIREPGDPASEVIEGIRARL